MSLRLGVALAVLGVPLGACSSSKQAPVPVGGTVRDIRALTGRWEGTYSSAVTGRSGSISFTLTATGDSAFGEVLMTPRGFGRPLEAWNRSVVPPTGAPAHPAALTINFVRVAAGRVTGTLAPYADPETGVQLFTTFEGTLQGDAIRGTYVTHPAGSDERQTGEWSVKRRGD
jgi:hypothetical protein